MKIICLKIFCLFLMVFLSICITKAENFVTPKAEEARKNPRHIWNWSEIGVPGQEPNQPLVGDFTLVDQLGNDTFLIPYVTADYKTKKTISSLAYLKVNCKTRKVIMMIGFKNGSFESSSELLDGSVGSAAVQFVCGTSNYRGILRAAYFNMENRSYVGWVDEELTESDTNPGLIKLTLYNYALLDNGIATSGTTLAGIFDVDCARKVLVENVPGKKNKIYDPFDPETKLNYLRYLHVISHACDYFQTKLSSQYKEKEKVNEKKSLMTIDEAKDKCKTLGFKTGTEKFGSCVLELTK